MNISGLAEGKDVLNPFGETEVLPLEVEMLPDRKLVDELGAYTPNKVVDELDALSRDCLSCD